MTGERIRRPTLDDLPAILDVMNDGQSVHRQNDCRHRRESEPVDELYHRLADDDNLVIGMRPPDEDEILAYASWQWFGDHVHLNVLHVRGSHQRKGYGRRLTTAFLDEIREHGATGYSLRAYADSPWALSFYDRMACQRLEGAAAAASHDPGLANYFGQAIAHGLWPNPEKVLYYERFG